MDLTEDVRFRLRTTTHQDEGTEEASQVTGLVSLHRCKVPPVHPDERLVPPVSLDIPMSNSPPTSPIHDQPPISQSAYSENERECADLPRDRTQETVPADQATQSITRSSSVIANELCDPRSVLPRNSDEEIREVPRQERSVDLVRMLSLS